MVHVHQKAMYAEYALRVAPDGERQFVDGVQPHPEASCNQGKQVEAAITSSVHRFYSKQRDSTLERGYNFLGNNLTSEELEHNLSI